MPVVNSCRFLGRLGQDPELQYTPGGTALVKVGLAVNGRRKVDDDWVDEVTWVNLTVFGKNAENISQYTSKGDMLLVDTQYQKRSYDVEGETRTSHDFIVREWQIAARVGSSSDQSEEDVEDFDGEDDDSLPF